MITVADILAQDAEELEGQELLLFNLAYQLSLFPEVKWSVETISSVTKGFEKLLDRETEEESEE